MGVVHHKVILKKKSPYGAMLLLFIDRNFWVGISYKSVILYF